MTVLNMACPACDKNGETRPLQTRQGFFGFYCDATPQHVYNDTQALLALEPRKLEMAQPVSPITTPQSTLSFSVDADVPQKLADRFGAVTNATLSAIAKTLTHPQSFVVNGEDANRMSERAGKKVSDSLTLVGIVSALAQEVADAKRELGEAKVAQSSVPNSMTMPFLDANGMRAMTIVLKSSTYDAIAAKAAAQVRTVTPEMHLQSIIEYALENGWF